MSYRISDHVHRLIAAFGRWGVDVVGVVLFMSAPVTAVVSVVTVVPAWLRLGG